MKTFIKSCRMILTCFILLRHQSTSQTSIPILPFKYYSLKGPHSKPKMSSDSFAAFRKSDRAELVKIAESHLNNDLSSADRDLVKNAGAKLRTHATVGSLVGLGLGLFFAFRIRRSRREMFNAFRVAEKPTHIQFAGGKTGRTHFSS
jgi:hypothetical protein